MVGWWGSRGGVVGSRGRGAWGSRNGVVRVKGWWSQGLGRSRGGGGQGMGW